MKKTKKTKKKMTKKEIERKKKKIIKTFFTMIIAVIVIFIALIINDHIILDKNEKINLVINNINITKDLKNDVLVRENIIYLSKEDIKEQFDPFIYEEEETNQIITTYDKKIAVIGFENNQIIINGSKKEIYAHAMKINEIEYLPISEMKNVYNIEIENIEETKVITIDFLDKEQKKAIVSSDLPVKSSTNLISKTVDRVKKGNSVVVISDSKGFSKIRTQNGKIGYVKSDKLENEYSVRENMISEKQINGKVNMKWNSEINQTQLSDINVVAPLFLNFDNKGNLTNNVGSRGGQSYIEWAHNQGYKIWPIISNNKVSVSNIINNYEKRQKLIEQIVTACVKYRFDGININFENITQEDKQNYSRFIIELVPRLKEIGLVTSVKINNQEENDLDISTINKVSDYIAINNENNLKDIDENKIILID